MTCRGIGLPCGARLATFTRILWRADRPSVSLAVTVIVALPLLAAEIVTRLPDTDAVATELFDVLTA